MNGDALSLSTIWMSDQPVPKERVMSAIDAALNNDRIARERERRIRRWALLTLAILLPTMLPRMLRPMPTSAIRRFTSP